MKIRPVGAELFLADDDEADSSFSQFCERTKNVPRIFRFLQQNDAGDESDTARLFNISIFWAVTLRHFPTFRRYFVYFQQQAVKEGRILVYMT
jgi:hypothetical protein